MKFDKTLKQINVQRESKAAAVENAREVENASEKLEASAKPAKGRPEPTFANIEEQIQLAEKDPEQAAANEAEYERAFEQKMAAQQAAEREALNEHRAELQRRNDPYEGLRPDGKRRPGPKRQRDSKRNDPDNWESFTAFCHPSTKKRVGRLVHLAKSAGDLKVGDQSDIMEAALTAYLTKQEKRIEALFAKEYGGG